MPNNHSQCGIYSRVRFVREKLWHKTITYINARAVGVMRRGDGLYWKVVKLLEWSAGAFLLAFFVAGLFLVIYPSIKESLLKVGMRKSVVLSTVGKEPIWTQPQLELCTKDRWLGNCEAALRSNAVQFWVWKFGVDTYLVAGFDANSKLVFKGLGDV